MEAAVENYAEVFEDGRFEWKPPQPHGWDFNFDAPQRPYEDEFEWPEHYPPLERRANLEWRYKAQKKAQNDKRYAAIVREMCRRDIRYWLAGWCWIFEPRKDSEDSSVVPFIPYPFQLRIVDKMMESLSSRRNLIVPKSRDLGLTWMFCYVVQHQWMFVDGFTGLLASRKEQLVDRRGSRSTLFGKVRVNLDKQPDFLMPEGFNPKEHDNILMLVNPQTGGVIEGASTTGEVGRSGRYNVAALDEHASYQSQHQELIETAISDAAASVWYISTPRGDQNIFAQKAHSKNIIRTDAHWSEHPFRGYQFWQEISYKQLKGGITQIIPGKIRAPWYDNEVKERDQPEWMIAQELDISFSGSGGTIMDLQILKLWRDQAPEPIDHGMYEHRSDKEAALLVWEEPQAGSHYLISADPSFGTRRGSFSTVQVFKMPLMQQVAEYQGEIGVDVLSSVVYMLARKYRWGFVAIEQNLGQSVLSDLLNGHIDSRGVVNGIVGERIQRYPERQIAKHVAPDGTLSDRYGISTNAVTKPYMVLSLLEPGVRNQTTTIRGRRTIGEAMGFRQEGKKFENPDGDDLVMAWCFALYAYKFMPVQRRTFAMPFVAT